MELPGERANFKTKVRNANPFIHGYDYTLGDRVGFQVDNVIFADKVSSAKFWYDVTTFVQWEIGIGTDYRLVDPVSKAIAAIAGVWNLFGMYQGSASMF